MSALPPEAGHDVEVKLLRNLVVFGRTLQGVAYLANDENVMMIFNQLLRQIQSKCGAKWPKTAQYLQTHLQSNLQELRSLTSNDHSIRTHISPTSQVTRPQPPPAPEPPALEAPASVDPTRARPAQTLEPLQVGQRKMDSAPTASSPTLTLDQSQSRLLLPGISEAAKPVSPRRSGAVENVLAGQPVLSRSESLSPSKQMPVRDLLKSNFVSVWLGPDNAFRSLDAQTIIVCSQEVGAYKGVEGGGPQWTQGDVQGCFRSAIGEKLPATCLFAAATLAPKKKRSHEAEPAAPQQRESKSQRTKRRKREPDSDSLSAEPILPTPPAEAEMTRKAAAAAIAIRRNASPAKGPVEKRKHGEAFIETVGSSQLMPEWRPDGSSWQDNAAGSSGSESEEAISGVVAPGEELYNVETIIDMMKDQVGREFYLIKWEGYPDSENTWEPVENIEAFGNHSARIRYLRAWYQARLKVSKRLARDPDYEWRPVTMQDKQLEQQMMLFIEKERESAEKFHTKAASAKTPGLA